MTKKYPEDDFTAGYLAIAFFGIGIVFQIVAQVLRMYGL